MDIASKKNYFIFLNKEKHILIKKENNKESHKDYQILKSEFLVQFLINLTFN